MKEKEKDKLCLKIVEAIRCKSAHTQIIGTEPVQYPTQKHGQTATSGTLRMPRIGKDISFGSSIERDFLLSCRLDHPIIDIVSQPFTILYSHKSGPIRGYTPDYLIQRDLSAKPSQFSTGEGEARSLIVEAKRVQDFLRVTEKDIVRLSAMNAWTLDGRSRAATFAFDTMFDTPLGERLKYFGRLSIETPDSLAREIPELVKSGRCKTFGEIENYLLERGHTPTRIKRSVHISIARGWLGYPALRLPKQTDVMECWHEVRRL